MPFTVKQFFAVFGDYNTAIWPAQIIAYVLGILACVLAYRESKISSRIISGILAFMWIWMGVVYHIMHFATINPAARIFGAFFIVQGLLFFLAGVVSERLSFRFSPKPLPVLGSFFILYAMAVYPVSTVSSATRTPGSRCSVSPRAPQLYSRSACCSGQRGQCPHTCSSSPRSGLSSD